MTRLAMFVSAAAVVFTFALQLPARAADSLVAPGAKVEKLADKFLFTEGPAADKDGNVFFSDIPSNRTLRWSTDGKLTTWRTDTGGANGLYFDAKGNLICCEGFARRLTSVSPDGKVTVLADSYDGKKLNSPNDLWVDPKGGIYFSDPRYGNMEGMEQKGFYVFYLPPGGKTLVRVVDDLVKPNGVLGTTDGKQLFVADASGGKTYVYTIQADGTLADKKVFAEHGSDGLTRDELGNVYLTGKGVDVFSPEGKPIETIDVPEGPANLTFGGPDKKTLFITARTGFYSVPMRVRGQ
jgi:gluconolactonase